MYFYLFISKYDFSDRTGFHKIALLPFKLHSMGLVRWCGNEVEPRCNLYRLYLHDYLSA